MAHVNKVARAPFMAISRCTNDWGGSTRHKSSESLRNMRQKVKVNVIETDTKANQSCIGHNGEATREAPFLQGRSESGGTHGAFPCVLPQAENHRGRRMLASPRGLEAVTLRLLLHWTQIFSFRNCNVLCAILGRALGAQSQSLAPVCLNASLLLRRQRRT